MNARSRGRLGAAVQILFAAIIGIPSWQSGSDTPEAVPRGIVLFAAYGLPGVIGYLGAVRGSRALLAAAALAAVPGSVLAFSGVTLIFLIPAALMGSAAVGLASREQGFERRLLGPIVGLALAVLMVSAGATTILLVTRPLCWISTDTPAGRSVQIVPSLEGVPMSGDAAGGCTSAAITTEGVGLGLLQGAAGLALALAWSRRRSAAADEA